MNTTFAVLVHVTMSSAPVADQNTLPSLLNAIYLDPISIVENPQNVKNHTGAGSVITPGELQQFNPTDVNRALRQEPGISIQVEDGYALRPNISIRGTASERSARITLLEDNVLIAPAPYAAPSAYYFPTFGRINQVEILKGPAAITHGPYTVGGALNMVSTPIPLTREGRWRTEYGTDNTWRSHLTYGDNSGEIGYLLEAHNWGSDGYQEIDFSDRDSGFEKQDYMFKARYAPQSANDFSHVFDIKLQYANEQSEQSYLGLTDTDFEQSPYRRYAVSALDEMNNEHNQLIARYALQTPGDARLVATAYYNTHKRNWFKTEGFDPNGSSSIADFSRVTWSSIIDGINRGIPVDGLTLAQWQNILDGGDTAPGTIELRNNDREYFSRGVQLTFDETFGSEKARHSVHAGVRFHQDEEDRLQRLSTYHLENGDLVLDDFGLNGNAGNRIQKADAWAVWVRDTITIGAWTFTPGLRYENMDQQRIRYETRLGQTTNPGERSPGNLRSTRENQTDVWIPGVAVSYAFDNGLVAFAGLHKGFTAPGNAPDALPEESVNSEFGLRFSGSNLYTEAVAFYTDYDNLVGTCTNASGGNCEIGDVFNGDAASILGLEYRLSFDWSPASSHNFPFRLSYTYLDGEFDSDIADTDFFGDVRNGDPLPYIPDHQLYIAQGWEHGQWQHYLSANYVGEVCTRGNCDQFTRTEETWIMDFSTEYEFGPAITGYLKIENLMDADDLVARHPYGARPNKGRSALAGIIYRF